MRKRDSDRRLQSWSLIDRLLSRVELKLDDKDTKISVADYIRLVQLKKELEDDESPQEVEVRWVDPDEVAGQSQEESAPNT